MQKRRVPSVVGLRLVRLQKINDGSFIVPPFHLPYPHTHATMLPPIALVATRNNK